MTRLLEVHRNIDGSIDFDFYRRRAARQRRLLQRIVFRRRLIVIRKAAMAFISAVEAPMRGLRRNKVVRQIKRACVAVLTKPT
jgi:hypothetical protein